MALRKRKSRFVLIIPRFEDIFHSFYAGEIIKGVNRAASRLQADYLVHITDRGNHHNWLDTEVTDPHSYDGILFADIDNDIDIVKTAIRRGMPCLVLNNILDEPINYVAVDNKKAACEVVKYLIDLGHRHIATIAGDISTQAGSKRLEGYRETLIANGINQHRHYITFGDFLRTPARMAAQKLLKLKERPTAIFAASDVMAMEVADVAKSLDIRIPEDLSVIGFDDNPLNTASPVAVSTVSQPLVEMGRLGLEHLYQIRQGKARLPVKVILETKLIKRKSTKKIA